MKTIFSKLYKLFFVIVILATIGIHKGKLLNANLFPAKTNQPQLARFDLKDINQLFPDATSYTLKADSIFIFKESTPIGWSINSSPLADSIVGFSSATPVLIGFDTTNSVVGVHLLENAESPDFIKDIIDSGFMESWNNMPIQSILEAQVDAVSGATETTHALIQTVKYRTARFLNQSLSPNDHIDFMVYLKAILGALLLLLGMIQFYAPERLRKYRTVYQFMLILILGFWSGTFLSAISLYNWTIYGIDLPVKLFVFSILLVSILLPLTTGKAFYCSHLCPYGACQDLLGKLRKNRMNLPKDLKQFLSTLREKVFATLLILLLLGVSLDLTNIEPFSAFLFQTASLPVIILAVLFLLLSIFIPRPWCNYACPTGYLLEVIRKPIKK
jgi:hypothetical protein